MDQSEVTCHNRFSALSVLTEEDEENTNASDVLPKDENVTDMLPDLEMKEKKRIIEDDSPRKSKKTHTNSQECESDNTEQTVVMETRGIASIDSSPTETTKGSNTEENEIQMESESREGAQSQPQPTDTITPSSIIGAKNIKLSPARINKTNLFPSSFPVDGH